MKIRFLIFTAFLFLIFTGCHRFYMICSLNQYYLEKNITLEDEIEGNWTARVFEAKEVPENNAHNTGFWGADDTLSTWCIKRFVATSNYKTSSGHDSVGYNMPEKYYVADLVSDKNNAVICSFKLVLFRINNKLYGDFIPLESSINSLLITSSFFRGHALARITQTAEGLRLSFLGDDTVEQMISQKRVRVKFRWVPETNRVLLTASPKELTAMLERYGDDKRFIDWDTQSAILYLQPAKTNKQ